LGLDDGARGIRPLWDPGNLATESGAVRRVNKDAKEIGRLFVRVSRELRVDLDDERGGYCGEETCL